MAGYTRQSDGRYHIPIIDLGKRLRDNFGLTIKEHSHFDTVDDVHAPNSYHKYDEALDIQDWRDDVIDGVGWKDRTGNLETLLAGSGAEIFGPRSGLKGHDTHLHIAAKGGIFKLNEDQYQYLFGGNSSGRRSTFSHSFSPPGRPQTPAGDDVPLPTRPDGSVIFKDVKPGEQTPQQIAKTRAKAYGEMSKAQLDSAYDALRKEDPAKAAIEGKIMHKAYFGK